MEKSSSVLSLSKAKTSIGGYLYGSPCLKPIFYNPFILSVFIIAIVWLADFIYGKAFKKKCKLSIMFKHLVTTYVVVASGICLNNMMIRHSNKLEKYEKKHQLENESAIEPIADSQSESITAQYV